LVINIESIHDGRSEKHQVKKSFAKRHEERIMWKFGKLFLTPLRPSSQSMSVHFFRKKSTVPML